MIDKDYRIDFTEGLKRPHKKYALDSRIKPVVFTEWVDAMNEYRKLTPVKGHGYMQHGISVDKLSARFGMDKDTFKKYARMYLRGDEMPDGFFVYERKQ